MLHIGLNDVAITGTRRRIPDYQGGIVTIVADVKPFGECPAELRHGVDDEFEL